MDDPMEAAPDEGESIEECFRSIYTSSIDSEANGYQTENGRRYHSYRQGRYLRPNDKQENDRLELCHLVFKMTLNDRLYLAPIGDSPSRVLDICTGVGTWAIEFGELFPPAEVIGNDLSPSQDTILPLNVKFIVDDVEDVWGYEHNPFDFIHARYLAGSVKDMPRLVQQSFSCLKPGGWVEFQDWDDKLRSDDGSLSGTGLEEYFSQAKAAYTEAGYVAGPGPYLQQWLQDAGFINIHVEKFKIPIGTWVEDLDQKKIGAYNLLQVLEALEGSSLAVMTRFRNWSKDEVEALVERATRDARSPDVHSYLSFFVVYGQKPEERL